MRRSKSSKSKPKKDSLEEISLFDGYNPPKTVNGETATVSIHHPNLKGFFHCLGVPFNVLSRKSMIRCRRMLKWKTVTPKNQRIALEEIQKAKNKAKSWKPNPLLQFLYDCVEEEQGHTRFTL